MMSKGTKARLLTENKQTVVVNSSAFKQNCTETLANCTCSCSCVECSHTFTALYGSQKSVKALKLDWSEIHTA